jgi:SAM-dependent methyltransferase
MNAAASLEPCPTCSSLESVADTGLAHAASHNAARYSLLACARCDLRFWSPLVADPTIYAQEGFEAYADYHAGQRPFPRWAQPLFDRLPDRRGAALDIGCGDGSVLARLRDAGFDPHGLDLDERSIAVATNKFGLRQVQARTLGDYAAGARAQGRKFGLITFFEVLEHQDAPVDFLSEVASLCEPGALVAGSVPNRQRFLAGADRHLGDGDLPPHHFLWFSPQSLTALLRRAGFDDISVIRAGQLSLQDVVSKLDKVVHRQTQRLPAWLRAAATVGSRFAAVPVWAGFRARPSHLFFTCHWPSGGGATLSRPA